MRGVCSECGLDFWWGDVLNPALTVARWSFEHAASKLPRRFALTTAVALAPWALWSKLRLEQPIRPLRLVMMVIGWLLLTHLALGAAQAIVTYQGMLASGLTRAPVEAMAMSIEPLLWPYPSRYWSGLTWGGLHLESPVTAAMAVWLLVVALAPLTLLLMPDSFRQARVRRIHIVRGAAYSAAALPVAAAVWAFLCLWSGLSLNIWIWSGWEYQSVLGAVIIALWAVWVIVFWWIFARRYLRLPHGALIGATALAMPVIFVATALCVFNGSRAVLWLMEWWSMVQRAVESASYAL